MFRLILTDLDGTLLRSDKTVSQETLSVLEECRAAGCLLGIAIDEVKRIADAVTESNDRDGVAKYLTENFLNPLLVKR